ncbi:MAG: ZIP family metal transporter [Nitrospirae bacterium]|jgi:zinc transporter, ZIP family|nr:ZIP family metal transporter [Nitrospirota bacterium]
MNSDQYILFAIFLTLLTGLTTTIGSIIAHFTKSPKYKYLGFALGCSAGGIIGVTMEEVLYKIKDDIGPYLTNFAFIGGMVFSLIMTFIFKLETIEKRISSPDMKIMRRDVVTAIRLFVHNIPEGIMVFLSTLVSIETGIFVAVAVAMHNIPQGFSLSISTFYITQDTKRSFLYSFFSGFIEPFCAILTALIVLPFLTGVYLYLLLAFVSGVLIYVSLCELIPIAHKYGEESSIFMGIIAGMSIMIFSLTIVHLLIL